MQWQLKGMAAALAAVAVAVSTHAVIDGDPAPPGTTTKEKQEKQDKQDKPSGTAGQSATDPEVDLTALDRIEQGCWSELRTQRIYFAHQSLGDDIVAGLRETMVRRPEARLAIVAYDAPDRSDDIPRSVFDSPAFAEASAGRRGYPERKIDDFVALLKSDEGARVDIAVLKLCYGDIGRMTNATKLAERYAQAVADIRQARPNVRLIHCTVPLKAEAVGTKDRLKRLVGGGSGASNAARARYNDEIRRRFPAEQVFDVAHAESCRADGTESTVESDGKRVPTLAPEFTEDGVRLNRLGQIVLAREFLITLSRQCGGGIDKGRGAAGTAAVVGDGDPAGR